MRRGVGDQHVVRALRAQVHPLPVRRAERVVRAAARGDPRQDFGLHRVDDPPRGIVAGDIGDLPIGRAGELVGARADRHPPRHRVGDGVEPEEFPRVALGVLDRDEDLVAVCGRDEAVRLRPDFHPLDHPVGRGVDDVEVVARGVGHVELLDRLLRARRGREGGEHQGESECGEWHGRWDPVGYRSDPARTAKEPQPAGCGGRLKDTRGDRR